MSDLTAKCNAKSIQIEATIIRCGCGDPYSHQTFPCPKGIHENRGTISYWHQSVFKRAFWNLKQLLKGE